MQLPGFEQRQTVTGSELAEWLGVSAAAITKMKQAKRIVPLPDGKYVLKDTVRAYCIELRGKKASQGEGKDLQRTIDYWRGENLKAKNLRWRLGYGRDIARAIIEQLRASVNNFRLVVEREASPAILEAILRLAEGLRQINPDDVVYDVDDEGDDELTATDDE
jgi:hypothetical protein